MKIPNLIIRTFLDLNEICLYVKYQLLEKLLCITIHSNVLRRNETRSGGIHHTWNGIIKTFRIWRSPARKRNLLFHWNL